MTDLTDTQKINNLWKTSKGVVDINKPENYVSSTEKGAIKNVLNELKVQRSDLLINLASKEYFTVLGKLPENINVVTPTFKDYKNGNYKIISFYAKKARGMMSSFLIRKQIENLNDLRKFAENGYEFQPEQSSDLQPVFFRSERNRIAA